MQSTNQKLMTNWRWWMVVLLFVATTVNYMDRQVLSLTWKDFIAPEFHWTDNDYGTITAFFSIIYAVCMLFAGKFVDWMGTKKGYLWAIGVWSFGAVIHAACGWATMHIEGYESVEAMAAVEAGSAAALGIDGVLLTPTCCDPLCRRAIRVSMGTALLIPFATVGEDAEDWQTRGVELLRREGFRTCAMALRPGTIDISDPALKGEERLAIILGTEGTGLAEGTIDACDYTVKIPMFRQVDSLNVAAAAAIAFWELKKR